MPDDVQSEFSLKKIPIGRGDVSITDADKTGAAEVRSFDDGDFEKRLENESKQNNHKRREDALQEVSKAFLWLIRFIVVMLIIVLCVWFWHLLAPKGWQWLEKERLSYLKDLLFSGALSASVTFFSSNILKK